MYIVANEPMWTDTAQAVSAVIGAIGVVVTLIITAWQIHLASNQVRQSAKQAESESEDRNRPYLSLDVIPSIGGTGVWDLRIENTGGTVARNITLRLINGELVGDEKQYSLKDHLYSFMNSPFDLMPKANRRIYWIFTNGKDGTVVDGAPLEGRIEIRYVWKRENDEISYSDYLSYDCIKPPIPAPATGKTRTGGEHPELKNIEYAIRGVSRQIGELSR